MRLVEHIDHQITYNQYLAIESLINSVWPHPTKTVEDLAKYAFGQAKLSDEKSVRTVVWENDKALAHARIFPRTIVTQGGELTVAALAGVCVSEARRGDGLGKLVVENLFRKLAGLGFPITLFQTGVPEFYKKLGAKLVFNTFINSQHQSNPKANPWWDDYVMIYPADYMLPDGEIDLNGKGY